MRKGLKYWLKVNPIKWNPNKKGTNQPVLSLPQGNSQGHASCSRTVCAISHHIINLVSWSISLLKVKQEKLAAKHGESTGANPRVNQNFPHKRGSLKKKKRGSLFIKRTLWTILFSTEKLAPNFSCCTSLKFLGTAFSQSKAPVAVKSLTHCGCYSKTKPQLLLFCSLTAFLGNPETEKGASGMSHNVWLYLAVGHILVSILQKNRGNRTRETESMAYYKELVHNYWGRQVARSAGWVSKRRPRRTDGIVPVWRPADLRLRKSCYFN